MLQNLSKFKNKLPRCPKFLVCCEKLPLRDNDSKVDFKRACFHSIYNIRDLVILVH